MVVIDDQLDDPGRPVRVRMITQIQGLLNGLDWPAPGAIVTLPATSAAQLVNDGAAVVVQDDEA